MRKVLVVAFDVTDLNETEIENLANAAAVQGEGSDDTDAGAYPAVVAKYEAFDVPLVNEDEPLAEVLGAVNVGLGW